MINVDYLKQVAYDISKTNNPRTSVFRAMIITPNEQIECQAFNSLSFSDDYFSSTNTHITVSLKLQPAVYKNRILPYLRELYIVLVRIVGNEQFNSYYKLIPLDVADLEKTGGSTSQVNPMLTSLVNFVDVKFQLIDTLFDKIKNVLVGGTYLASTVEDVLYTTYDLYMSRIELSSNESYEGLDVEEHIDNDTTYSYITIPQGTKLTNVGRFLQNDTNYGVYNQGLGTYWFNKFMMIYPLFRLGKFDEEEEKLMIIRVHKDITPAAENTFISSNGFTQILLIGDVNFSNTTDLNRQNKGVGKRVINAGVVSGEQGVYAENGRAIKTREDTLIEFKTSEREDEDKEYVPFSDDITSNSCKHISEAILNDMEYMSFVWSNSNYWLLKPSMPVMYYYINSDSEVMVQEGVLISHNTTFYSKDGPTKDRKFYCDSLMTVMLNVDKAEVY